MLPYAGVVSEGYTVLDEIDVIAWDFDGVLNRNIINDQILWIKEISRGSAN